MQTYLSLNKLKKENLHKILDTIPLIAALKHKYEYVRSSVAKALTSLKWQPENDIHRAWYAVALQDWDKAVRLGQNAIEPLIAALRDITDDGVKVGKSAARALGKIGDPRAVEPLIAAMRLNDEAAEALVKIGKPAVEPLIAALRDESEYVRSSAADALDKINPDWPQSEEAKRQVPGFIAALSDKDSDVREAAAEALGKLGDPRAVEPLIKSTSATSDGWFYGYSNVTKALNIFSDELCWLSNLQAVESLLNWISENSFETFCRDTN